MIMVRTLRKDIAKYNRDEDYVSILYLLSFQVVDFVQGNRYFGLKLIVFKMLTFLFLNQTLWCYHSLESSRRDDFNEGHTIGLG